MTAAVSLTIAVFVVVELVLEAALSAFRARIHFNGGSGRRPSGEIPGQQRY